MDIGWFRDLVICIWGLVAAIVLIFVAILVFSLYRKTKVVLNSIDEATQQGKQILTSVESSASVVQNMVSTVDQDLFKPLMQIVAIAQGVRYGVDMFSKFFNAKKGGSNAK